MTDTDDRIPVDLVFPRAGSDLTDEALLELYTVTDRSAPFVRANFVATLDGSATAPSGSDDDSGVGLSGALGGPADKRVFDLLRRLCDVVLVGSGTIRAEGYGAMRLPEADVSWRVANGLPEQPAFAIISGTLNLDPVSDVFVEAPVRPIVLTTSTADTDRRAALSEVAEVVSCGIDRVDPSLVVAELSSRGLMQIHSEGGPGVLGDFIAADLLDSLCLTVSPSLEGGAGPRIAHGGTAPDLRAMTLDHLLVAGDMLLTKYSRDRKRKG